MYSRIIQLETTPVPESDYIIAAHYDLEHWFLLEVADFVDEDEDREATLHSFLAFLSRFGLEQFPDGFALKPGFHARYFARDYARFRAVLDSVSSSLTLDSFVADSGLSGELFALRDAYEDKFTYYVQTTDNDLLPLARFLRLAKPGTRYYFGGTVSYHW